MLIQINSLVTVRNGLFAKQECDVENNFPIRQTPSNNVLENSITDLSHLHMYFLFLDISVIVLTHILSNHKGKFLGDIFISLPEVYMYNLVCCLLQSMVASAESQDLTINILAEYRA